MASVQRATGKWAGALACILAFNLHAQTRDPVLDRISSAAKDTSVHSGYQFDPTPVSRSRGGAVGRAGGALADSSPEDALTVAQALSGLTRIERQTLWLAYVEGWSWREVGRLLGYREGSIRQVGVRARRRFRELFGESRP